MGADLALKDGYTAGRRRVCVLKQCRQTDRGRRHRVDRHHGFFCAVRIERAMRGCGEEGLIAEGPNHPRDHRAGHYAVMRPVAAAAGWQARVVAGLEGCRKWPQPKEQHKEDG